MFNTLIWISYDGTNYSGFQIQENAPTVQAELERALAVIYKEPVRIAGAGRTDSGVHALGQAANYMAPFKIEVDKLPHALNTLLPSDIVVTEAETVADDFHARFTGSHKLYSYSIDRAPVPQVLRRLYSWHLPFPLDLDALERAAQIFRGTHDFKAFQSAGSSAVQTTTRTLNRVDPVELPDEQLLVIYFEGSGFLYHMVRLITGSLVRAGRGRLSEADIELALVGGKRSAVGPTAPAHGLCLEEVIYR